MRAANLRYTVVSTAILLLSPGEALAVDYFVDAGKGLDGNPGTSKDQAFKTIQKGVDSAQAGDTVFIAGGTAYRERVSIHNKGSAGSQPLTIQGDPAARPLVDGTDLVPTLWDHFLRIEGSQNVVVENIELAHSRGRGIYLGDGSDHVTLRNLWIHDIALAAVWADNCDFLTIEGSRVWQTNLVNKADGPWYQDGMWMGALVARGGTDENDPAQTAHDIIIRKSEIFQSYGEGVNLHGNVNGVVIEDNVIWDCWSASLYGPNASGLLYQRNLIYHTNDSQFLRGGNPDCGICFQKENPPTRPGPMKDITIINNFVKGFRYSFGFWPNDEGALENTLIANNTFVDGHSNTSPIPTINIGKANHKNVRFDNNLVHQEDVSQGIGSIDGSSGVTFSHNLWSSKPADEVASPNDVMGDPLLVRSGSTGPGLLSADYFRLKPGSPAIDQAMTLTEVTADYFGTPRGNKPDMGAHEYTDQPPKDGGVGGGGGAGGTGTGGTGPGTGGAKPGTGGTAAEGGAAKDDGGAAKDGGAAPQATAGSSDDGCGCRVLPRRTDGGVWVMAAMVGWVLAHFRRRR